MALRRRTVAFTLPALVFLAVTIGYALLYNARVSLSGGGAAEFINGTAPYVGFQNYINLFTDPNHWNAFRISLIFSTGALLGQFTIALVVALAIRAGFKGSHAFTSLFLLAWILPSVITGSLFRWLLDGGLGLVNYLMAELGFITDPVFWLGNPSLALFSVTIASIWLGSPFQMVLLLAGLRSLPQGVYEAARVDGATRWQEFRFITWPLMRPIALTVLLLSAVLTFKAFDHIFVMTRGGPARGTQVLPLYTYEASFGTYQFGLGAAASVVLMVIPFVLGMLYIRQLRIQDEGSTGRLRRVRPGRA